jgi:hypothetical protein
MRDDLSVRGYLVPAFDSISSSGGEGVTYLNANELRDAKFVGDNDDDTKPEYNYDHLVLTDGRKFYLITADLDYDDNERRVAVCPHTHHEVVQQWDETEWLCLHNDTLEEDAIAVTNFKGD